jgi:hypothetical protein
MGEPDVLEKLRVREVTGVFASRVAATPAVDDLLRAGFDRADIDTIAEGERLVRRLGDVPAPARALADVPEVPRQEFVAQEDTAGLFAVCVAVTGCFGAMIGALLVMGPDATITQTIIAALAGGVVGCGLGMLMAQYLGRRWLRSPLTEAGTDGLVLWVRVRSPDREQKALRILRDRGAEAVHVHEIEIEKRLEDLPLSSLLREP